MIFHGDSIKTHDIRYEFVICSPIVEINHRMEPTILLIDMVIRSDTGIYAFPMTYRSILLWNG